MNSGAGLAAIPMRTSNKKYNYCTPLLASGGGSGERREERGEDELVDCIRLARWLTVILTV